MDENLACFQFSLLQFPSIWIKLTFKTCSSQDWRVSKEKGEIVTKQDPMGPSQKTPTHILHLPFVCRKSSPKEYVESEKWECAETNEKTANWDQIIV